MNKKQFAQMLDHTLLKPAVTLEDLRQHCETAVKYQFKSVAINSAVVAFCKEMLGDTDVLCDATIGFPLGQCSVATKVFETKDAIDNGAREIDYVVNLVKLKSGHWDFIEEEMRRIVATCNTHQVTSKVIFETCYLTDDEKKHLCEIACRIRPAFVKTSTGFGISIPGKVSGATLEDVQLMKHCVGNEVLVKASGGIRTTQQALAMIKAGASRIGTSCGVAILEGLGE
ncbi:deoxyribose-phosphate aldolase [Acutalibacter caecimuris]|uniref:deoxyribose-phosphate aldolase n=1 Tax=Acutalibacter caecimuris TaxID=3093657 RepID=UPI002AC92A95|nr:deoxyribose-phosphate aldolase [Acutalibacter sp. M00118]